MLICVVILFLLCWGPRFIMELLMKMQFPWLYKEHVYVIRIVLFLLPMVHAILNPVVYFIMNRNFRNAVLHRCSTGCTRNHRRGSFEDFELKNRTQNFLTTNDLSRRPSLHNGVSNRSLDRSQNPSHHELVVVRANGQVTVDLIDQCQGK